MSRDPHQFTDDWPGYVILPSSSQKVFLILAYQTDADDLFDLAAETIAEGEAPEEFDDFSRFDLDDFSLDAPNNQGSSEASETGEEFCFNEPSLETFDANDDGAVTIDQLEEWSAAVPEIEETLRVMEANGNDSIRYVGC